ncbi:MAG TPA: TadE/TadG family type IV pilus assembly protein [Terriglobales bacterium]|nr:TadE/TadG family type IV pilus assembly protein [Terriglobales bacterium]
MLRTIKQQNGEAGSGLIEFTVVALALLTVMLGIVDLGRALYAYNYVSDAARRGARYAIVRGSKCDPTLSGCPVQSSQDPNLISYVESNADGINTSNLSVTASCCPAGAATCTGGSFPCDPGNAVQVQVQYTFNFITPLLPQASWKMTSTSEMTVSQ